MLGVRSYPQQISASTHIYHVYRFLASGGAVQAILQVADFLGVMGVYTNTVNTSVRTIMSSVKILSVEMWSPPPAGGAPADIDISWIGAQANSPDDDKIDTTLGADRPGHVFARPPRSSLLGDWWNSGVGSQGLINLTCPAETIIDVHLSGIMSNHQAGVTIGVATAAAGNMYYLALDSHSGHNFVPVGLPTTF